MDSNNRNEVYEEEKDFETLGKSIRKIIDKKVSNENFRSYSELRNKSISSDESEERIDELYKNIMQELSDKTSFEASEIRTLQRKSSQELGYKIDEIQNSQVASDKKIDQLRDDFDGLTTVVSEQIESFDGYRELSIEKIKEIPSKIVEVIVSNLVGRISFLEEELKNLKEEVNSAKSPFYDSPSGRSPSRPTTSYSEDSTIAAQSVAGCFFDPLLSSPIKLAPFNRVDHSQSISTTPQNSSNSYWNGNRSAFEHSNFNTQIRISELEERVSRIENNAIGKKKINEKFIDFKSISPFKELVIIDKEALPGEEDSKPSSSLDGNIISKFFQKLANSKVPNGNYSYRPSTKDQSNFRPYLFSKRVTDEERSLKEWCEADFKLSGSSSNSKGTIYNNNFFPKDLKKTFSFTNQKDKPRVINNCKDLYLGTGAGKTTTVVRCIAFHNKEEGVTVVVPNRSLIGSFITSHNDWLSKGKDLIKDDEGNLIDDPKKRVTVCQICSENHAKESYQVIHNEKADLINVFTWDELMKAFALKREIIKKIIIFDEAHVTDIWYKKTIDYFANLNNNQFNKTGQYDYKIIRTSATFPDLPSSSRLTGAISDYYVNPSSIADFCHSKKEFLSKKIIVFCSDRSYLDFKVLDENGVEYLVLNEGLERYATQIVQSTNSKLVIADSSYSLGFNFGDVNVISTGISSRKVIKREKRPGLSDDFVFQKEVVPSEFSDLIQERGRCAREKNHSGIWVSFLPENSKDIKKTETGKNEAETMFKAFGKLKDTGISSLSELDQGRDESFNEKILETFGLYHFNKKELSEQDKEKSFIYLRDIFLKTLCDDFVKKTLFSSKNFSSEKERVIETEFIFENDLITVVADRIPKQKRIDYYNRIIRFSSWEMIKKQFEVEYPWARRTQFDESDEDYKNCFNFQDVKDAEIASFIVSLRDSENCYKIFEEKSQRSKRSLIKIKLNKDFIDKNKQNVLKSFNKN